MDIGSAFWQAPLRKEIQELTALVHPKGFYKWTRMPFGLCNATATFQRLMAKVLEHMTMTYGNVVLCYVDDLLVATTTIEEHLKRLREVFHAISRAGLKLKPCLLYTSPSPRDS